MTFLEFRLLVSTCQKQGNCISVSLAKCSLVVVGSRCHCIDSMLGQQLGLPEVFLSGGRGSALEIQASYKVWLMQFKQHGQYREPIPDHNSDDISSVSQLNDTHFSLSSVTLEL